jgi:hypothetical protein
MRLCRAALQKGCAFPLRDTTNQPHPRCLER